MSLGTAPARVEVATAAPLLAIKKPGIRKKENRINLESFDFIIMNVLY
jgi:hypothetical protein